MDKEESPDNKEKSFEINLRFYVNIFYYATK